MKGAGHLRLTTGRRLISPPGITARPTTSRVREAVMNILAVHIAGCRWLDLCCGSGVMSCEALERGAESITAVDKDIRCTKTCKENLKTVSANRAADNLCVVQADVLRWLSRAEKQAPFDLVYFDPPYDKGLYQNVLSLLLQGNWIHSNSLVICEHRSRQEPDVGSGWTVKDRRRYGESSLVILNPQERYHHGDTDSTQQQTNPST